MTLLQLDANTYVNIEIVTAITFAADDSSATVVVNRANIVQVSAAYAARLRTLLMGGSSSHFAVIQMPAPEETTP